MPRTFAMSSSRALRGAGACIALLALVLTAAAGRAGATSPAKGSLVTAESRTLVFAGEKHEYLIQPVLGSGRHPVVIILHGGERDAKKVWTQLSLPTLGKRYGFIAVAPNALMNRHWNDGRNRVGTGEPSNADDVGYLRALIAEVVAHDGGDPTAIFMFGFSNGGFMTIRFACEAGELLRAAGVAASSIPIKQAQHCAGRKPLPWISINGDRDPNVNFNGQADGTLVYGRPQAGLLSADKTFAFFADKAKCRAALRVVELPDIDASDGSTAEERVRSGCSGGTTSTQYVLHGAGHTLPGNWLSPAEARLLGRVNGDIDAGTVIWAHFQQTLDK